MSFLNEGATVAAKHQEITADLKRAIEEGAFPVGSRLPGIEDLAQQYKVSKETVSTAIRGLANMGLVTPIPRKGTIVRDPRVLTYWAVRSEASERRSSNTADAFFTDIHEAGREPSQKFESRKVPAPSHVAEQLELEQGQEILLRRCMRSVDGIPWSIQDSYFPPHIVRLCPELESPHDIARGTINALRELGIYQVGFFDELTSRMPTPDEHQFFRTPRGIPVLVQTRTAYTTTEVVRVAETIWAADRNRVIYEIGDLSALYPKTGKK